MPNNAITIHEKWVEWMAEIKDTEKGPASETQRRVCRANFYMGAAAAISILRHTPRARLALRMVLISQELMHDQETNPTGELK